MRREWKRHDLSRQGLSAHHELNFSSWCRECRLYVAHGDGLVDAGTKATTGDFANRLADFIKYFGMRAGGRFSYRLDTHAHFLCAHIDLFDNLVRARKSAFEFAALANDP